VVQRSGPKHKIVCVGRVSGSFMAPAVPNLGAN
jgi:hypothetical protein